MPTVSAVLVFHKDTPYLRPAIASVLGQTWRDFELVLVDNGTGLSADALGELGRDPRVRWVRRAHNDGIEPGYNDGFAAAAGEFIAICDSDDIVLPHRFEQQVATLRGDAKIGYVSALAEHIDERGRMLGRIEFTLPRPEEHTVYSQYADPLVTPATMGRREHFAAVPYRLEFPFAGNFDLWARASERTQLAVLPEVHLLYRCYPSQTTQSKFQLLEQSRCIIQLLTARRRAGRPERMSETLQEFAAFPVPEKWRRTAATCLREGFNVLGAFQARRSFILERSPSAALAGMKLGLRALGSAKSHERALIARMLLSGPVRAHRLHPA